MSEPAPKVTTMYKTLMQRQLEWARDYNAYERIASNDADQDYPLERLFRPIREEYARTHGIPTWCGIDLLRAWAFLLFRLDYWGGGYDLQADGQNRQEWEDVLRAAANHPAATGPDVPPVR